MAGKYVTLTDENFDEVVLKSDKPVLVDFWAAWCGPCKMFAPTIEELAEDFEGKAVIAKLDVDEAPDTAARYKVMSIPTVILFVKGKKKGTSVGVVPKAKLAEMISAKL